MTEEMSGYPRLVVVSATGEGQQGVTTPPGTDTRPPPRARPRFQPKGGPGWAILRRRCQDIINDLACQIADGKLAKDTRMASVQKLMDTHRIPSSAARHILRTLAVHHFIRLVPGLGYVVGVPGVTPLLPHARPSKFTLSAFAPPADPSIPGADVLLAERQVGGRNSSTFVPPLTVDPAHGALTGLDAIERGIPTYLFAQVFSIMAGRIAAGQFLPGQRFASIGALRREFGISDSTARRVMRELTDHGLIHRASTWAYFTGPAYAGHPLPRYQQIAVDLAGEIFTGRLPILHVIPLRRELREHYGVSFRTVDEAVSLLRSLGWIMFIDRQRPIAAPPELWPVLPDGSPAPDR